MVFCLLGFIFFQVLFQVLAEVYQAFFNWAYIYCCSCQNNFIKCGNFGSSDSENNFWKSLDSSGLILWPSVSKAFLIAYIYSSNCLHCSLFCCKVSFILSGDVNFTGAFKWAGFAKEAFLQFTSVLNLIFSCSQILLVFSGDNNNKMQFLVLKYSSWNASCFKSTVL